MQRRVPSLDITRIVDRTLKFSPVAACPRLSVLSTSLRLEHGLVVPIEHCVFLISLSRRSNKNLNWTGTGVIVRNDVNDPLLLYARENVGPGFC